MYPLKKILVGLDMTELDTTLVQFAAYMARISDAEQICFCNVVRNIYVPEEVLEEFPDLVRHAVEDRRQQMIAAVNAVVTEIEGTKLDYIVVEGQPTRQMLKLTVEHDIDLVIVGRKVNLKGNGILPERLARRVGCSLFIIPENSALQLKKIMVPMDFSDYSVDALRQALIMAEKSGPTAEIVICNVYSVPLGYHYTGKSYREFAEIMKSHARKDYLKLLQEVEVGAVKVTDIYSLSENNEVIDNLYQVSRAIEANVMVIGAKGRTATTALFLGSVAERLIILDKEFPLLVIRPKGKNAGIIEALKEI